MQHSFNDNAIDRALTLCTRAVVTFNILEASVLTCLSVLQARGEDQDPGEKGQRPDRGELHGAKCGSLTAGQSICLFYCLLVWFYLI